MYLVKKSMLVAVVGCFFSLVSCSGSSGSSFEPQDETANKPTDKNTSGDYDDDIAEEKVIIYENEDDVPECTRKKYGTEIYIVDVAQYRVCLSGEWRIKRNGNLDKISSSSTAELSSSAEALILSSVSEISPLDEGSFIRAEAVFDGQNGYNLRLQGYIRTDSDEFETKGYNGEDRVYYGIDSLHFDVGDKDV